MKKKPRPSKHPLVIAVAVAIVGLAGTIATAIISSSQSNEPVNVDPGASRTTVFVVPGVQPSQAPSVHSDAPSITVDAVTYVKLAKGVDLSVSGTALALRPSDAVYAVAGRGCHLRGES